MAVNIYADGTHSLKKQWEIALIKIQCMITAKQIDILQNINYKFLTVSSPVVEMNGFIPEEFTCKGKDTNPPFDIELIPENTKSLAIVMDEPDAPYGCFCHWLIWNLPVVHHIREDENRGMFGMNDLGNHRYNGPCPTEGVHRYFFRVYALNKKLDIPASCDRMQFDKAMRKHIVGYTILVAKCKT